MGQVLPGQIADPTIEVTLHDLPQGVGVRFAGLRRLRTSRPSWVETIARKPSHLSLKDHPEPKGRGPRRESMGSGSRRGRNLSPPCGCLFNRA